MLYNFKIPSKVVIIISLFPLLTYTSYCSSQKCEEGINLKPMYGKVKKCKQQINADNNFLNNCDKEFKNRNEASNYYIQRAWYYFNLNILDTSMFRFNQAWLLDSTNADLYWGFGNLLGKQKKYKESLPYFEKSLQLNPNNARVWQSAANSFGSLYSNTNDSILLQKSITYLMKSVQLDSSKSNVIAYAQLVAAYTYLPKRDSAIKYLNKADQLDSTSVNPKVRQLLK